MNKLIRFLIYKNYEWQLFVKMRNPIAAGIFGVVFPWGLLLLGIVMMSSKVFNFELSGTVIVVVLVIIFCYEHYLQKKVNNIGIETIVSEFKKQDERRKTTTTVLVLLYSLTASFSPILLLLLFFEKV